MTTTDTAPLTPSQRITAASAAFRNRAPITGADHSRCGDLALAYLTGCLTSLAGRDTTTPDQIADVVENALRWAADEETRATRTQFAVAANPADATLSPWQRRDITEAASRTEMEEG